MTQPDAPFDEPWQAQVFALTVALNEAGHLPWSDWAAVFGPRVQGIEASAYWQVWAEALVIVLAEKDVAQASEIASLTAKWQAAAKATPHGQPILLKKAEA